REPSSSGGSLAWHGTSGGAATCPPGWHPRSPNSSPPRTPTTSTSPTTTPVAPCSCGTAGRSGPRRRPCSSGHPWEQPDMNKTTLRSTQGHTFKVTGQLNTLGGQCSGLDLAVREGGSGTRYVVKWLIKGHQDEIARNEILLKMTALQAIPQVLAPRDIVRDGNRVGIVTPYLECGMTIEELLQNPRSVREHMVIALQLAHLVALLEGLGIHHGDLSSQNAMLVLVAGVPRVFLIDLDNASGAGLPPAMMMGGEFYAAAERENTSNQPDASSEAYSLAVMLHELLLGTHPFQNDLGLTIEQARRTPW